MQPGTSECGQRRPREAPGVRTVVWGMGALGFAAVTTQLVMVREALGVFLGNEVVLGALLGNWLWLTAVGTWIGGRHRRSGEPAGAPGGIALAWLLVLAAVLPEIQLVALRALRPLFFPPGFTIGPVAAFGSILVILLPFCVVSGCALAVAVGEVKARAGGDALRRVYVADCVGSVAGGLAVLGMVVAGWSSWGVLGSAAGVGLAAASVLAWTRGRHRPAIAALALGTVILAIAGGADLDGLTWRWQPAGGVVRLQTQSAYGRLVVTESAGQRVVWQNGLPISSDQDLEAAEESVHLAMAQRPAAGRVLLLSGLLSGALAEVLKYPVAEVVCLELDPALVRLWQSGGVRREAVDDARVRVVVADSRVYLRETADRFDVVLMRLPDPATALLNRFYTTEFCREAKRVLRAGGVLAWALGRYENVVSPDLARLLSTGRRTLESAFRHVEVLPGGRVWFLASDGPLTADIAGALEAARIPTRSLSRAYLEAQFSRDRRADIERATTRAVRRNSDLNPVLYWEHLRHWLGQYPVRWGLPAGAVGLLLLWWLARWRGPRLTLLATGFSSSALNLVILLQFQSLCGSLYREVALLVVVFMAGLAAGSWWTGQQPEPEADRRRLVRTSLGLALAAAALPPALQVAWGGNVNVQSLFGARAVLGVWLFLVAVIAGAQFPLAGRLETGPAAQTAARLFSSDLAGAALGAMATSTVLLPALGIARTCGVVAVVSIGGAVPAAGARRIGGGQPASCH